MALSGDERDNWIRGLNYLVASVKASTYQTAQERMLRKYFYSLEQPGREGTPLSKLVNLVHIKHTEEGVFVFRDHSCARPEAVYAEGVFENEHGDLEREVQQARQR